MTDTAQYTRRILRTYRAATDEQRAEGMEWYRDAYAFASSLDSDVERAAAVIAVLSPMLSWPRNKALATNHYNGVFGGCLSTNSVKAQRILSGEDYRTVLSGDKVTAFFHNILMSEDHVTIDRHAIDIALGAPQTDAVRSVWMGKRKRAILTEAYRRAAHRAGVSAPEMQAVTWVAWRQTRAQAFHG